VPVAPPWSRHPLLTRGLAWAVLAAVAACAQPDQAGLLTGGRAYPPDPPTGEATRLMAADLDPGVTRLRLGITPYTQESRERRDLAPLVAHVSEALGIPVELVSSGSYGELVAAITEERVDVALLSPVSYVQARAIQPALHLAARAISQGSPEYSSYIIVRRDDPAHTLADLRGRRMAWVDRLSGSGYLYPRHVLRQAGLDPERMFASAQFYGTHEAAMAALLRGEVDAAAVASGALALPCKAGEAQTARGFRVLHKCGKLPYDALAVRAGMGREALKKITWVFQGLNNRTEYGRKVLADTWAISGWMPADESVYEGVRAHLEAMAPARAAGFSGAATLTDLPLEASHVE